MGIHPAAEAPVIEGAPTNRPRGSESLRRLFWL
jgi:hypothetical protein